MYQTCGFANLFGDEDEPNEGEKHHTGLGGLEETSNDGGNQETRINTSPKIKRVDIDPILTVAKLEKPEMRDAVYTPVPIDISTPDISEDIGNITHGIEALNAENEVEPEVEFSTKIIYNHDGSINHLIISHGEDTNGYYKYSNKMIDSLLY